MDRIEYCVGIGGHCCWDDAPLKFTRWQHCVAGRGTRFTLHCRVVLLRQEQQSDEQKETALMRTPSLLEICGHSYYFGGFLVGPQVTSLITRVYRVVQK